MDNFIKNLEIKNFKSIKHLSLDCKRVNVFIGKPNVGKSNILEATALLGWWDYHLPLREKRFFDRIIRYKSLENLFYDNFIEKGKQIRIKGDRCSSYLFSNGQSFEFINTNDLKYIKQIEEFVEDDFEFRKGLQLTLDINGKVLNDDLLVPKDTSLTTEKIEKYDFTGTDGYNSEWYISPRHGDKLYSVIESNKEVRVKIVQMLNEYGLEFVISKTDKTFIIQKKQDGFVYQYPYSSIADTFQRFIFYLAAIESNSDSVLIFEEPEVHSFPPYVKELAERMILKDDNQYFVSTHSPYLLQTFIDSLDDTQLNVYLTYYKDYQTHVKALTPDELSDIQRFGYDVFFNLKKFEPND
ncbi:AAA family ATPase [Runella sp.]|uniref:AAA family ATPase n=1 Tax=Runella sp. TaxID=1960881 RepID=UPI003D0ACAB3